MFARTVLMLLAGAAFGAVAAPAGYVISVAGTWKAQGVDAPLTVGAEVLPGAVLRIEKPTPFDGIKIVAARTGAIIVEADCAKPAQCSRAIVLPTAPAAATDPRVAALLDKLFGHLRAKPERYAQTISRSERTLDDALARLDAAGVDLAPAFSRMPSGSYAIAQKPIACAASVPCSASGPTAFIWRSTGGTPPVFSGTKPGLYELSARDNAAEASRVESAWVLVVGTDRHAAAAVTLRETEALIAGWGDKVEPAARAAVRRASLAAVGRDTP